jgi:hypothetical protein
LVQDKNVTKGLSFFARVTRGRPHTGGQAVRTAKAVAKKNGHLRRILRAVLWECDASGQRFQRINFGDKKTCLGAVKFYLRIETSGVT